jgi:cytochrome c553
MEAMAKHAAPCMACHGKEGRAAPDGYYPRIAGKPAGYLYNQLLNFRDGRRLQYPLMAYTVQHLSDAYLHQFANFFAQQQLPYPPPLPPAAPPAALEHGRKLIMEGDGARRIPACAACHGKSLTGIAPSIPGLLGLPRDYINAQIGTWRIGKRHAAEPDCMAQVVQQLTPEDVSAVSSWLAAQTVPANASAAQAPVGKLPLACGSFPQ